MPTVNELYTACNVRTRVLPAESKLVFDFCQLVYHVEQVEMLRLPTENSLELRIRYLSGVMNEDEYKHVLQKNEKCREKCRDINNILTMLTQTGSDILRQFVRKELTLDAVKDIIVNLLKYTNDTLCVIGKRYSCVVPQIDETTLEVRRLKSHDS